MSKTWTFVGGMLAGVASVFAAAAMAVEWDKRQNSNSKIKEDTQLALPESENSQSK